MSRIVSPAVLSLALMAFACQGDGSDIGPRLPRIPDVSSKVVVLDDQGRGVVDATVAIVGTPVQALTGRNGRGDLLAAVGGRVLLRVDGRRAAAVAGDRLPELLVATTVVGPDLPTPIYLPALPDAASAQLAVGTQTATTTVTSTGGSILTVPAGASVGTPDAAATVDVRLGELLPEHLPGDLPLATSGSRLFGRGVFVDPPAATFTPGLDLDVADDVASGTLPATLYHLDPANGEWQAIASTVAAGGRFVANGAIERGGLYAWGVEAPVPATSVAGRVVDTDSRTIPGVMVRVDRSITTTANDGTFTIADVASARADGSPRSAPLELFAGGSWLPVRLATTVPVTAAAVDVGDLTLDTLPAGNIRVQQVVRARPDAFRPVRLSSLRGSVAMVTAGDANGQSLFEDVPADFFGYQEGRRRPENEREVYYGQAISFLDFGRRWLDSYQFLFQRRWFVGSRSTRAFVCDFVGGGPIAGAEVIVGGTSGEGLIGTTLEGGSFFVTRDFAGRGTASHRTERDGRSITHALTFVRPNSDHVEFPLRRVLRQPLGAFDRHGLFAGNLTGVDASREHELRVTRRITRQEWWDDVVDGESIRSSLPIDVDPAVTHGPYQAGMAVAGGNLAATEFTSPGAGKTLARIGLAIGATPVEGQQVALDLALDLVPDTVYPVQGALAAVDPRIDVAALRFALALGVPSDRVVDIARNVRGNLGVAGSDLTLTLPPLDGALADSRWLALVTGEQTVAAGTFSHASLIELPSTGSLRLPPLPTISQPAIDATVPASGFPVEFTLPPAAVFATIELRQDTGSELLLWQVVVPRDLVQFTFVSLPVEADTPLLAGRTYTLTLTAWFGDVVTDLPDPYPDLIAWSQSIGPIEAGLTQIGRHSIQISTN